MQRNARDAAWLATTDRHKNSVQLPSSSDFRSSDWPVRLLDGLQDGDLFSLRSRRCSEGLGLTLNLESLDHLPASRPHRRWSKRLIPNAKRSTRWPDATRPLEREPLDCEDGGREASRGLAAYLGLEAINSTRAGQCRSSMRSGSACSWKPGVYFHSRSGGFRSHGRDTHRGADPTRRIGRPHP